MTKMSEEKKEKRLLPGDFQRMIKYEELDNTRKELEQNKFGFFQFPEQLKGEQFQDREFLVFYFDDEADYKAVRAFFEVHTKTALSHPELSTDKLIELVKEATAHETNEDPEQE